MPITNLEQVFTSKSIASNYNKYLETANMQPFLGQVFFEDKKQDSLKLEFIKGKAGLLTFKVKGSRLSGSWLCLNQYIKTIRFPLYIYLRRCSMCFA